MTRPNNIKELINEAKNVVITTHFKPDGDALGSSLGLYHWLVDRGHSVQVVVPSDFPYFLDWLPGREKVIIYTEQTEIAEKYIAEADIIFCLDFNGLGRLNAMQFAVANATAYKYVIDHHLEPEGFEDEQFINSHAAATAQLVYQFISEIFDDNQAINADIATCLYTGIMTDTGSFRFKSTTSEVHRITADLIDKGAQNWRIHEQIYNSNTERRLKFLGFCLANRLTVLPEFNTAYFAISKEDLEQFEIQTGDTEGLVNYALSIHGMRLAALIIERKEAIKLSFRSIGDFPCNELSKAHFNGGGHRNAAGGQSQDTLTETVIRFNQILPNYKTQLTQ